MENATTTITAAAPQPHTSSPRAFIVKKVALEQILSLRNGARFEGDEKPDTCHMALLAEGVGPNGRSLAVVSCATFVFQTYQRLELAWRLGGVVMAPAFRDRGLGTKFIDACARMIASDSRIRTFWCEAPLPALSFFERLGWRAQSPAFDIDGLGPHRIMLKRL